MGCNKDVMRRQEEEEFGEYLGPAGCAKSIVAQRTYDIRLTGDPATRESKRCFPGVNEVQDQLVKDVKEQVDTRAT